MSPEYNILIVDGKSTWSLSVINCLAQSTGYKIHVLSSKKRTATKYSKYTKFYKYSENSSDYEWLTLINDLIKNHSISVIIPVAEEEIGFFIKYSSQISFQTKVIPLPGLKDFETAINKLSLSKFLGEQGLPHPKSFNITSFETYKSFKPSINFPILVKPLHEKGGDGILKFKSAEKFETYLGNKTLFIQEYIEGFDIDCSVLCKDGEILTYTIQKGNLPGHNQYAPQLGVEFLENEAVFNISKKLMYKLNWSGIAHIDLRYDENNNDYKIIEVNARFWGSLEASKYAGVNFPDLAIKMALGEAVEYENYKHIHYLRFKGFLKSIKRKPLNIFKLQHIINNTEVSSVLKDPIPTLYKFREWLGRVLTFSGVNFAVYIEEFSYVSIF